MKRGSEQPMHVSTLSLYLIVHITKLIKAQSSTDSVPVFLGAIHLTFIVFINHRQLQHTNFENFSSTPYHTTHPGPQPQTTDLEAGGIPLRDLSSFPRPHYQNSKHPYPAVRRSQAAPPSQIAPSTPSRLTFPDRPLSHVNVKLQASLLPRSAPAPAGPAIENPLSPASSLPS